MARLPIKDIRMGSVEVFMEWYQFRGIPPRRLKRTFFNVTPSISVRRSVVTSVVTATSTAVATRFFSVARPVTPIDE